MEENETITPEPEFTEPDDSLKVGARNSAKDKERLQQIHDYAVDNGAECAKPEAYMLSNDDTVVFTGDEIKALDDGKIGGYLVRFSTAADPDASRERDYFDAQTDFGFVKGETKSTPVWFNHRLPIKTKAGGEIAIKEKIGDGELTIDDDGVFIEAVLYNRKKYEKVLAAMGWSSGTAAHLVDRKAVDSANHVDRWPLGLDASMTPIPAEPRTQVIPLKSLSDNEVTLPPFPPDPDPEGGDALEDHGDGGDLSVKSNLVEVLAMDITKEELQEIVKAAVAEGATKAIKDLPAEPVKAGVSVTHDEADNEFADAGEFFKAVKSAAYYPQSADVRLQSLKATGLSEGVPADGGYLIPPQYAAGILSRMYDTSQILSRISADPITGNTMVYNGVNETTHVGSMYGGVTPCWLAEGGTKVASQPAFYQVQLKLKKIAALCYATDELLEDTGALASWLMRTVPDVMRFYVEDAIFEGDGVGKPLGFTQAPCFLSVLREDANEVNPSDFATMWSRRWTGARDYVWFVNAQAAAQMNQFAVGTFPVYMPGNNMTGAPFATVYGAPVIETEYNAAFKSANDVVLASLSNYQAITKGGIQTASSIHVAFTTDESVYRFVYRIDGSPLWQSALTPLHGSTVSPFVGLGAASS